nr:hypothetical protein [Tanacetum cinerariifolium]
IAPILGYGDLVQGVVSIKRVYYVEGLNHNLFSVGQFCDADSKVAFRKSTCYVRDLKGNDLLTEGILHQTSVARTHEQNGVVERRNRTLVEAARTMLSAAKVPLFFRAKAIATTCFTQNRSLIVGIMVNALCKEGKLQAFVDMIDRIDEKRCLLRLIVNTCFVFGMVEEGRVEDGLVLLKRMMVKNMISDSISYSLFVYVVERLNGRESVRRANEMLTVLLDKGFVTDVNTFSYLIVGYGRECDVEGVLKLYYEMKYRKLSPGALLFNWLVISFCQAGRLEESEKYSRTMKARSLVPLDCAYDTLLSSLRKDTKA